LQTFSQQQLNHSRSLIWKTKILTLSTVYSFDFRLPKLAAGE